MAKKDHPPKQAASRKISRKEISGMSRAEYVRVSRDQYKRILGYLKPHKSRFAIGVIFGVAAGLFNGVLLLVIRTVFTIILPPDPGKPLPEDIRPFEKMPFWQDVTITPPDVAGQNQWLFVILVCMTVPLMILLRGALTYLHQYCMIWVGNRVLYQLRDDCFSGILRQSQKFFNQAKQGELMQTVFNQTRLAASAGTDLASAFIKHPVSILTIVAVLLCLDWKYTLGAFVVFPLCILPVAYVSEKVRKAGSREEEEAGEIMVTMHESFAGIKVVKAHAREQYERKKFNEGSRKMMEFIMRWKKAMEIVGPMVEVVASLGMAIGLVYAWHQKINAGEFLVLNMALMSIYPHAKALSRVQIQLQKCLMATSRVFAFIDTRPDIEDKPDAIELTDAKGDISFENVCFSYVPGTPALREVNVSFEAGKNYALVGQSGGGKSTMLSLIMRFYDPNEGVIRVDGIDIREYTQQSLRDQIGFVSQETFLFHDTILRQHPLR